MYIRTTFTWEPPKTYILADIYTKAPLQGFQENKLEAMILGFKTC